MGEYEKLEYKPLDLTQLQQENIYEDRDMSKGILPAYEREAEAFISGQKRIMDTYRMAAGSSGTAGLATAMSQQQQDFGRKQRADLSTTLTGLDNLRLQEQARLNNVNTKLMLSNMEGERQFEYDKMATLLGVSGQQVAGARQQIANEQAMWGQIIGGVGSAVAGAQIANS